MKKLYVLIFRSYAGPAIATFFISVFVLLMQFLWRYVDDLVGKGLEWKIILQLLYYASYTFVPMALPLSILLASLMTFGNLGERYELVAMKAAGISLRKIMTPLIILSALITIGAFVYSNTVFPYANLKFRTTLYDVRQKKMALNIREGMFYSGIEGYVIRIGKKAPDGVRIYDVVIYDHTDFMGNNKFTLADSGRMEQSADGDYLLVTLFNGWNYEEKQGRDSETKRPFQRTLFSEEIVKFDLTQFRLSRTNEEFFRNNFLMLPNRELSHASDSIGRELESRRKDFGSALLNNYQYLRASQLLDSNCKAVLPSAKAADLLAGVQDKDRIMLINNALGIARNVKQSFEFNKQAIKEKATLKAKFDIEWHRKFTLSFACLALFLIGAPLGAIIRKGGLGLPLVVSVLLFVIYHVISFTGEKAVKSGVLLAWKGMWISTLIFLPIGIWLTYKAATDSPIMESDSYKRFVSKLLSVFRKKSKKEDL
ncbi:MAG TPA: LptF/LptG family permease [Bacteroidales bacterium]|nr:LptF/LptG family permease [Bacteroidales bacterium]